MHIAKHVGKLVPTMAFISYVLTWDVFLKSCLSGQRNNVSLTFLVLLPTERLETVTVL